MGGKSLDLYRFDLDQEVNDKIPEVWAIKNESGDWQPVIWQDVNDKFAVDITGDGVVDGWVDEVEVPDEWIPGNRGGGGKAPRFDFGIRDLDLNNDEKIDLLSEVDESGKEHFLIDRNQDGRIGPEDEKVEVSFTGDEGSPVDQIQMIMFEDGSWWQRDESESGGYKGYGKNGIPIDISSGANDVAIQQGELVAQYGQWYSPFEIGRMGVGEDPHTLSPITPPGFSPPLPSPLPSPSLSPEPAQMSEEPVERDHGVWLKDEKGNETVGVQSGRAGREGVRLTTDVRGGVDGMVEAQLKVNNSFIDPDADGIITRRMIIESKDPEMDAHVEVLHQPVGDGQNIIQAMTSDPEMISLANKHEIILSVERVIESYQGWFHNQGVKWWSLSDKEKMEIGREFARRHSANIPNDNIVKGKLNIDLLKTLFNMSEEEIKEELLEIIPEVEEEYD